MKLRLVVIDDEVLVRKGIITSIDWNKYGIDIAGEAFDGKSGLEVIRNTRPHLVLTDIRMPNMNGLQLIEKVQEEFPDIKFLILSVLEEFQTVREALQLGVTDYISKLSMTPEELLQAVLKIKNLVQIEMKQHSDDQQQSQKTVLDNGFNQWMFGGAVEQYEERVHKSEGFVVGRVYFQIDNENRTTPNDVPLQLYDRIKNILFSEPKEAFGDTFIFQVADGCFSVFILMNKKVQKADLLSSFQNMINLLKSSGFIVSIGISDVFHDAEHRKLAMEQAAHSLEQRFYSGDGFVHDLWENKPEPLVDFFDKKALSCYFQH